MRYSRGMKKIIRRDSISKVITRKRLKVIQETMERRAQWMEHVRGWETVVCRGQPCRKRKGEEGQEEDRKEGGRTKY